MSIFLFVGAPKSGTTALYSYLSTHPDIFLPTHKEPNYFAEDYPNIGGRLKTLTEYEKLYVKHNRKIAGDASVCYLASDTAPKGIKNYNPRGQRLSLCSEILIDLFLLNIPNCCIPSMKMLKTLSSLAIAGITKTRQRYPFFLPRA